MNAPPFRTGLTPFLGWYKMYLSSVGVVSIWSGSFGRHLYGFLLEQP